MIISEKQILQLMKQVRRYRNLCEQQNWHDHNYECKQLLDEIEEQQSDRLEEIR